MRWAGNKCRDWGRWQLKQLITGWPKSLLRRCALVWAQRKGMLMRNSKQDMHAVDVYVVCMHQCALLIARPLRATLACVAF